ncbi:iron uptake porin [Coleofasciculus sp. FACHB-542]|uniref:iron uptake porin n=1 Tax=Coleofasciculus sp. FACHB-542 TaxID=2692787 RepID=UPI00168566BE|nr:iron uptake porin [Coleofasciculus sp. FACHB-542]MBD2084546.1 iron uptake porin [Coleofasciculus sp. FACHB-542]
MFKLFRALGLGIGIWGVALLLCNRAVAIEAIATEIANTEPNTTSLETIASSTPETQESPGANSTELSPIDVSIDVSSVAVLSEPTRAATDTNLPEAPVIESVIETELSEKATTIAQTPDDLEPTSLDELEADSMEQVTSVTQLSDVQPTDWAFQALESLVERYGCIAGYPDSTFRGNRALSRYEFAAGLNACLNRINQLIQTSTGELASQEDLATLQRLQTEFAPELATLLTRVGNLEASVTQLEEQRFSTTTRLRGEILFAVSGVGGGEINNQDVDANVVLSNRVELNLDTSFSGQDLLRTRLAAQNTPNFAEVTGTNFAKLSFTGNNENDIQLGALFYRYPVTEQAIVYFGLIGIGFGDFTPTLNPYVNNSLLAAVSNFAGESQLFGLNGGTGFGLEYRISRAVRLSLGYLASNTNQAETGLFGGRYGAIAQVTLYPTDSLSVGLTYIHSYNIVTGKGSRNAEDPFNGAALSTNAYGLQASYQVSPNFNISGWTGLINARAESEPHKGSDAKIFTWALSFALPDVGGLGNLLGFVIGQPPKAIENDVVGREDPDTSLHLEAFYRYQLTDNIAITPGFFVITNPEHNANNDLIYVGTVRTSFVF